MIALSVDFCSGIAGSGPAGTGRTSPYSRAAGAGHAAISAGGAGGVAPRRIFLFSSILVSLTLAIPAGAQQAEDIGTVRPTDFSTRPIAVPPFEAGSGEVFSTALLSSIISNDLAMSGFFHLPRNADWVLETEAQDRKDNEIHYAEWYRIGAHYVVKGHYEIKGDDIEAEVRTYDTTAGKYIFGRKYVDFKKDDARRFAHHIANDIIEQITTFPGVAHTQILLVRESGFSRGQDVKDIFVIDADGHGLRQLSNDQSLTATPAWGLSATEIYYTTWKDFNPDLSGSFLDGSYTWYVSRRAGMNLSPHWSLKRKSIVLSLSKDGNSEIYTMNRRGEDLERLTFHRAIDSSPVWSLSGEEIAFTSDRNGTKQIYLMDAAGLNVRQLTRQGTYNDSASWSPLGDRIAFTSRVGGVFQIFTIGLDGQDLRQLTDGDSHSEDPSWAPNGWVIAYTSEQSGSKQIHTITLDGRPIAQLTRGKASYSSAWSPMLP